MYGNFMKGSLIDLFFPRFCLGCGFIGIYICPICESKMEKVKDSVCFYCGRPSFLGFTHPRCRHQKGIDGFLSIYSYNGLFRKLLQESKYKGAYAVLYTLLAFFHQRAFRNLKKWNNLFRPIITSVPLHMQRIRERGFNQSDIIVEQYFGHKLINLHILERTTDTAHLANIKNKNNRESHVRAAFTFVGNSVPKTVLLVDDVVTSGSTISECSKTLKENGVQTVLAFSLARG